MTKIATNILISVIGHEAIVDSYHFLPPPLIHFPYEANASTSWDSLSSVMAPLNSSSPILHTSFI